MVDHEDDVDIIIEAYVSSSDTESANQMQVLAKINDSLILKECSQHGIQTATDHHCGRKDCGLSCGAERDTI